MTQFENKEKMDSNYKKMFMDFPDAILIFNNEKEVVDINSGGVKLYGSGSNKIIRKKMKNFFPEISEKRIFSKEIYSPLKNEDVVFRNTNGKLIQVKVSSMNITGENNDLYVLRISENSDNKNLETEIKELKRENLSLFTNANDLIIKLSLKGKIIDANRKATEITGYKREDLPLSVFKIMNARDVIKYRSEIKKLLSKKKLSDSCYKIKTKSGESVLLEVSAFIDEKEGKSNSIYVIGRDITEKEKSNSELIKNEENFRNIFNSINDVYAEVSVKGKILEISPSILNVGGYTREECIGRSVFDFYDNPRKGVELLKLLKQESTINDFEVILIRKDGRKVICSYSVKLVKDNFRKSQKIIGTMRDISKRKKFEQKLIEHKNDLEREVKNRTKELIRKNSQLANKNKLEAIGELAGGVAHSFNNILGVILGHSEKLSKKIGKDKFAVESIDEIILSVNKSKLLTEQLLAFSRKQIFQLEVLNLNKHIKEIIEPLLEDLQTNIKVDFLLSPELGNIKADLSQVRQVLINLYSNAVQAMPEGGLLLISTKNVEIEDEISIEEEKIKPGIYIELKITDDGCGIEEKHRDKIFEPFFTTKELKKGEKGKGLGLASVFGIMNQSRGHIFVESSSGKGTTLRLLFRSFNMNEDCVVDQDVDIATKSDIMGKLILVVDDDTPLRLVVCDMLNEIGFNSIQASSGDEALSVLEKNEGKISFIISDMIMPEMSGGELYKEIMKRDPGINILFMSAYTISDIVHEGVLIDGFNYIKKPFTTQKLRQEIMKVINKGKNDKEDIEILFSS